jgi:hypothetical protein
LLVNCKSPNVCDTSILEKIKTCLKVDYIFIYRHGPVARDQVRYASWFKEEEKDTENKETNYRKVSSKDLLYLKYTSGDCFLAAISLYVAKYLITISISSVSYVSLCRIEQLKTWKFCREKLIRGISDFFFQMVKNLFSEFLTHLLIVHIFNEIIFSLCFYYFVCA